MYFDFETSAVVNQRADSVRAALVSPEFFRVLGTDPVRGRVPEGKDSPGVAISHGYWQSAFGGDPQVLGKSVKVFDRLLPVLGVMPAGFQFPPRTDVWGPASIMPETTSRSAHNYQVVARLKNGVSAEQAQTELSGIAARLESAYPRDNKDKDASVLPLRDSMTDSVRPTLLLLLGAVGVLMLIACANVANLLLSRAASRRRELAVRAALGADRSDLIRHVLAEAMVLATCGAALGLLIATVDRDVLLRFTPAGLPRLDEVRISLPVYLFAIGASAVAVALFGLLPAIAISSVDLQNALKSGGARVGGHGTGRLRPLLVVVEVALAVLLLAGASLLGRTLLKLTQRDPGFRASNLTVMETKTEAEGEEAQAKLLQYYDRLGATIAAQPGVESAAIASELPGLASNANGIYIIEGRAPWQPSEYSAHSAGFQLISEDYFRALGVRVLQGRVFEPIDRQAKRALCVISESLAKAAFPNENPLGKRLKIGFGREDGHEVIGVVSDVRARGLVRRQRQEFYAPYWQYANRASGLNVIARVSGKPSGYFEPFRRAAEGVSAEVPLRFHTGEGLLSDSLEQPRFRLFAFGVFAGSALLLAAAGLFGLISYQVGQRVSEIGVRMALGASPGSILRLIVGSGLRLTVIGIVIGGLMAVFLEKSLESMLIEVKTTDPLAIAGTVVVLLVVSALAAVIPALRAARLDPMMALRQE
jgi:predicted permease